MWIPALLVTTLLSVTIADTNVTSDVAAFIAKFRELNETVDVLDSLEKIGEHSRELFRLGRPVGNLLRTFNETGETTIEEEEAFTELNHLFKINYAEIEAFHHVAVSASYDVIFKMMPVLTYMDIFTNVTHRQNSETEQRLKGVKAVIFHLPDFDPITILSSIDDSTRVHCLMPTKEGIRRVVRVQEAFRRLESQIRSVWNDSEYATVDYYKNRILSLVHSRVGQEDTNRLITTLDNLEVNSTSHSAVMAGLAMSHYNISGDFTVTQDFFVQHHTRKSCVLETTMDQNAFNQTVMYSKLRHLHRDLLKVQLLVWATSSLRESEDDYYNKDTGMAVLALERTGPYIAKWTRKVQEMTWPEMGIEFAKRSIELGPIRIADVNETARKVQKAFEEHGSPSYAYQVLVVPSSEVDVSWSVACKNSGDYANITSFYGIDFHVFRFTRADVATRGDQARNYMALRESAVIKGIRSGYLASTSTVLSNLQSDSSSGPIYDDDHYRCVILLRKKSISPTKYPMEIYTAIDENAAYRLETSKTSYSVINKGKESVYSWKAFFFL